MTVSISDQIKEAGRELGMRKGVYAKWVAGGKMTQAEADQRIAAMDAIYATLKGLQAPKAEVSVERVARAIARGQMSRNMKDAPPVTQELYLDAVWKDYEQAALNAMTELGVMP